MSAGKERALCVKALANLAELTGTRGFSDVQWLQDAREDARQPLIADMVELRTKHKALQEQLRQVEALCAVPDGNVTFENAETFGEDEVTREPYVLVASLRKILETT